MVKKVCRWLANADYWSMSCFVQKNYHEPNNGDLVLGAKFFSLLAMICSQRKAVLSKHKLAVQASLTFVWYLSHRLHFETIWLLYVKYFHFCNTLRVKNALYLMTLRHFLQCSTYLLLNRHIFDCKTAKIYCIAALSLQPADFPSVAHYSRVGSNDS